MKKIILIIIGIILIAFVIKLGFLAAANTNYVVWFGLASALLVPTAFGIFGFALRGDDRKIFSELSKVPQINELIEKAKNQEEKIAILEKEKNRLTEIIKLEARRQTLITQKTNLENTMLGAYKDYSAILQELELINEKVEESPALEEIKKIQKRIKERKDGGIIVIRFGKREMVFRQNYFSDAPIEVLLWLMLKLTENIQKKINKKKNISVRS